MHRFLQRFGAGRTVNPNPPETYATTANAGLAARSPLQHVALQRIYVGATVATRPERRRECQLEHPDRVMTARLIASLSNPIVRLVALVSIAFVLAACGQGGDGGAGY